MKKYRIISGAFDRTINSLNSYEAIKLFSDYVFQCNGLIDKNTYLYEIGEHNPNMVYLVVDLAETLKLKKVSSSK
jgi:hypothetical protein